MLKKKCAAWEVALEGLLAEVEGQDLSLLDGLTASVKVVRSALAEMRVFVLEQGFTDEAEEIWFFKSGKPRVYARLIGLVERYNLLRQRPVGCSSELRAYYLEELEMIRRFFRQQSFLYAYYREGMTELDGLYFLRGKSGVGGVLGLDLPEADQEFSAGGDYLFGKFMALEKQQDWLVQAIGELEPAAVQAGAARKVRTLKWTGESIHLVELGYGLHEAGQFNNGKAGIGEIFSWLEENLGISIGIPARRFVEISRRKRLSRTKFLDQLRDAVNRKADEADAYVPGKGNSKYE